MTITTVTAQRLLGKVRVSGAKNSALRMLAASILTEEAVFLSESPNGLSDMKVHIEMLEVLGKSCGVSGSELVITESSPLDGQLSWEGRSIRNTLLILGALTARLGYGSVPLPGGCALGDRKYDLHVNLLESMGARVWEENGFLYAEANGRLKGVDIRLPFRSTGATENAILAGTLAEGTTTIWNPHIRPEILDLVDLLKKMGAEITVHGQQCIVIEGQEGLHGAKHTVCPDNMEAITWAIGSVITGGEVEIERFPLSHLETPLIFLRESGMRFFTGPDSVIVSGGRPLPVDISTGPYPGINSDMQPLFAVYGACSAGKSRIIDLRFPGRFDYAQELAKMGAKISFQGDILEIEGGSELIGADVIATDLRAGAALYLAGLTANGETKIHNSWQIERGYENFHQKLAALNCPPVNAQTLT